MPRYLPLVIGFALAVQPLRAEDIPAATLAAVKKATVFVRVQGDGWGATGSGFVVGGDDKALFLATNQHVAEPDPPPGARPGRVPTLSVVFDSGTKAERVFSATVAGSDAQRDLAVLRVVGVKEPPKALTAADTTKLTETAAVYTFGFPFGEALSTIEKANPAITVGKASVSSFRNGPDGELAAIQIDGNLNPGNSGGPVVNAAGQFVGVAVSRIKSAGIGFIVPAGEMDAMLKGRVSSVRVVPPKPGDGPKTARIEATIADPTGRLKETYAYFLLVPQGQKPPAVTDLIEHPDSRKILLKFDKGVGVAEVPLKAVGGEMLLQVAAETAEKPVATKVKPYPLGAVAGVPSLTDVLAPPPAGWKEYMPSDKSFKMWVPEKPAKQSSDERTSTVSGQRMRVSFVLGETAAGLVYEGQTIRLPLGGFNRPNGREMHEVFRDALAEEMKGKVTESKPVRSGRMTGYEHRIEVGKQVVRMRVCLFVNSVLIVQVVGTAEQVASVEAETMLISFGFAGAGERERPGTNPSTNPEPKTNPGTNPVVPRPVGKEPTILGGAFDPIFKELAPDGGLLVGFEIGTAQAFGHNMTRAAKPIYRVGDKESFGEQRGTQLGNVVTLKAKPGYAVGAVSVMSGLGFDGIKLTYMKVANGKLDPADSYDSEYVGSDQKKALTKLGGDGTPVIGVVGKTNAKDLTGLGILLKGQEGYEPKKR